jgi:hypothetical protein
MGFCPLIKDDCKGKKCMMYYEEGDACSINCMEEIKDNCEPAK